VWFWPHFFYLYDRNIHQFIVIFEIPEFDAGFVSCCLSAFEPELSGVPLGVFDGADVSEGVADAFGTAEELGSG